MKNHWLIYAKERFPFGTYLFLGSGLTLAAIVYAGAPLLPDLATLQAFGFGAAMTIGFFAVLRLMDEVKDFHKDQVAHPERPLPRGLIAVPRAKSVIRLGLAAMLGLGALVGLMISQSAGVLYLITTIYLYLMYREFYVGKWLERFPLTYALTHQLILLPLLAAVTATVLQDELTLVELLLPGLAILPAFFAYEVGRKLDPEAHPILRHYRTTHGLRGCRIIFALLVAASLAMAAAIHIAGPFSGAASWLLLALQVAGPVTLLITALWAGDSRFKLVETVATLNLVMALYAPVLARLVFQWLAAHSTP